MADMSSDETAARKPIGIMSVPLAERLEAIRAHWNDFDLSGATSFDHERDQIIGFLLDQVDSLRDRMAAYVERDSADAAAGSYAGRAEQAEAELAEARARLAEIGDGHPRCRACGKNLGYRNCPNQLFCWPSTDGEEPTK